MAILTNCLMLWGFLIIAVSGDCTISIEGYPPLFVKAFGSRKVLLEQRTTPISLEEGEAISAYCSTQIRFKSQYSNWLPREGSANYGITSVELICNNNGQLSYKTPKDRSFEYIQTNNAVISCSTSINQNLFESHKELPSCRPHMTYAIGMAPSNMNHIITAGLCYDLDALQLKFVNYLAARPKYELIPTKPSTVDLRTVSLDKKLSNLDSFFTFMTENAFLQAYALEKSHNPLLYLHDFNYASIIQDAKLLDTLKSFQNMLNIVWWLNLQLGNWAYYLEALQERSKEVTYNVYTGTSGLIWVPMSSCNRSEILSITSGEATVTAPKYIWSYLKALSGNVSEEFVVVGYNSPFSNDDMEAVFCKDICEEIDWLRKSLFGQVHSMPSMGRMFCCRPEEVAKKFDFFPLEHKPNPVSVYSSDSNSIADYEEEITKTPSSYD